MGEPTRTADSHFDIQRATAAVLNQTYEEVFLEFSYGFQPKRSRHDTLDALMAGIGGSNVSWIIDADIRSFFDTVSQEWLIRFLEHRVADSRIIRLIRKWLKAGVLEDGAVTGSETGTGQRSVISPLLANVCRADGDRRRALAAAHPDQPVRLLPRHEGGRAGDGALGRPSKRRRRGKPWQQIGGEADEGIDRAGDLRVRSRRSDH